MGERQIEALRLLAEGLSAQQVANRMGVSYFTVRGYVREIRAQLAARNVAHAVHLAWQQGILP